MKNKRIKIGAIIFSILLIIVVSITFILKNEKNPLTNKSEIVKTDGAKEESNLKNKEEKDTSDESNLDKNSSNDLEKKNNEEDKKEIDFNTLNDKRQDSTSKDDTNKDNANIDNTNKGNANNDNSQNTTNNSNTESKKPESVEKYVTISITCNTILNNLNKVTEGKKEIIPSNGVIMGEKKIEIKDGDTVFDVLVRETRQQRIHMDFMMSPVYNSAYIKGINNIYEFDGGDLSGWMYSVNGVFPNYGCSQYQLKDGDSIQWKYTCDLGRDL